MHHTEIDHLVIAADTLAHGAAWCEATLGVASLPGGEHVLMSTHNRLLNLSSTGVPQCYLEIIAINPAAPAPGRARWFGLDQPALQQRLREHGPELVGFVARSAMVDMHQRGLIEGGIQPGPTLKASRQTAQGLLEWQIVVPDDGLPLVGGAVPTLIQWSGQHPTAAMPDSGLRLQQLTVRGMPDQAAQVLRLRALHREPLPGAALSVTLATPKGEVSLSSHVLA